MTVTNDTLIISLTSYPARIGGVLKVIESINEQIVRHDLDCHMVFVLAESEFPGKDEDLPLDLLSYINDKGIELIWYPRNIRSHKKIIPTLKKYPDNPILVCDDDIIRDDGWLEMFIKDHEKYPDDIIAGTVMYCFDSYLAPTRIDGAKCQKAGPMNGVPNLLFNTARPANGSGGTLYPAHTFTDERFFDEDLMMSLSPTSDESWQFCFATMKGLKVRQSSIIYDNSIRSVEGTQQMETALHKVNKTLYPTIFKKLCKAFPEFLTNIRNRQRDVVVSMTTYGERLQSGATDRAVCSILSQEWKNIHFVLVITEHDKPYLSKYITKLIDDNRIELITVEKDLGPHKKYFYTMKMYRDLPIITVDDDAVYSSYMVSLLMRSYLSHPDCVSALRTHRIVTENGDVMPYNNWEHVCRTVTDPSHELFATGVGGVLYPPGILDISDDIIPDIERCLWADDVLLKHMEVKKNIRVVYVPGCKSMYKPIKDEETQKLALYKQNCGNNRNDEYIKEFNILPDKDSMNFLK